MRLDDIRFLFAYDRWATRRILAATADLEAAAWPAGEPIGSRHLGEILVHQLGAHQRWRHALAGLAGEPEPEREPLPTRRALATAWDAEWEALDGWLPSLDDAWLVRVHEGVPRWQMLAHVVNHGTQHRSEAAALLTGMGHSPGELDMIFFSEEIAAAPG